MVRKNKGLSFTPFTEDLIHRYYFEKMYTEENVSKWKKLLPTSLQNKWKRNFNLLVHEDQYQKYRADFTLYFKNESGIPVEIKWKSSGLQQNQINELKRLDGFVVCFEDDKQVGIQVVKLSESDFRKWLVDRVDFLWEEMYKSKVNSQNQKKYWIVTLKGKNAWNNWNNMLGAQKGKKRYYWAHKTTPQTLTNLFDLNKGDEVLFAFLSSKGHYPRSLPYVNQLPFTISKIAVTEITKPYYMELGDTVFETESNPANKKWVHFYDFEIQDEYKKPKEYSEKNLSKELYLPIARSFYNVVAWQITQSQAKFLKKI